MKTECFPIALALSWICLSHALEAQVEDVRIGSATKASTPTPNKPLATGSVADPAAPLRRARAHGKYRMLLRQMRGKPPGGAAFVEAGKKSPVEFQGQKNLPTGYWVYAKPFWFLWRDRLGDVRLPRQWGPDQVTGAPNSRPGADHQTAWATLLENRVAEEWLTVEFDGLFKATEIRVFETYCPGAIHRVSIFKPDGEEVVVWRARKVGPTGKSSRTLVVRPPLGFEVSRAKIYLHCSQVKGWNEIDAVALIDPRGAKHWAVAAMASSTYATKVARPVRKQLNLVPLPNPRPVAAKQIQIRTPQQQIQDLKAENRLLAARLTKLEASLAALQIEMTKQAAALKAARAAAAKR